MTISYPTLRSKVFSVPKTDNSDLSIFFDKPYLIIGLICPEVSVEVQYKLNQQNLMPYELSVREFMASDYKYDLGSLSNVGSRTVTGMALINSVVISDGGVTPVIVSYLEFDKAYD